MHTLSTHRSFTPRNQQIPQYAMYFPIYEYTRRGLKKAGLDEKGTAMTIAAGGIAGAGQWIPTYPFDVVKTKIQVCGCLC